MLAITFFGPNIRIYGPLQKSLRKMNVSEKYDYAVQISDYVFSLARSGKDWDTNSRESFVGSTSWWESHNE
jgi:hypothetical protein